MRDRTDGIRRYNDTDKMPIDSTHNRYDDTQVAELNGMVRGNDKGYRKNPILGNLHIDNMDGILVGVGNYPKLAENQVRHDHSSRCNDLINEKKDTNDKLQGYMS